MRRRPRAGADIASHLTESSSKRVSSGSSLLAAALPQGGNGAVISWATDPGPDDLAGYKLEKAEGDAWRTVVALTRDTRYTDRSGGPLLPPHQE